MEFDKLDVSDEVFQVLKKKAEEGYKVAFVTPTAIYIERFHEATAALPPHIEGERIDL